MSFGRKGNGGGNSGTPRGRPVARPLPEAAPSSHEDAQARPSGLSKSLVRVGIGVGLALGLIALNYVGMQSSGRSLARNFEGAAAAVEWTEIIPLPYKSRSDLDERIAKVCLDLLPVSNGVTSPATFAWALGRGELHQLATVGEYIACSVERVPERFCEQKEKGRLQGHVAAYLGFRRTVLRRAAEQEKDGRPAWGQRDSTPQGERQKFVAANESLARIASTIRSAVEIGYLSPADVRPMLSGDLKPLLEPAMTIKSTEKPCQ